ncbi:hypothetical protein CDD81_1464 [Ophiocordyceps australis]|uniref:Uncharacterized protein n=1 Tax=Ophiocordyceps australis TaxID=1399860 RepID=A0A2C5YAK5_9HYPO|nr:hypothetical protein CDD81_1464 [Ophiocordyceps australis]
MKFVVAVAPFFATLAAAGLLLEDSGLENVDRQVRDVDAYLEARKVLNKASYLYTRYVQVVQLHNHNSEWERVLKDKENDNRLVKELFATNEANVKEAQELIKSANDKLKQALSPEFADIAIAGVKRAGENLYETSTKPDSGPMFEYIRELNAKVEMPK